MRTAAFLALATTVLICLGEPELNARPPDAKVQTLAPLGRLAQKRAPAPSAAGGSCIYNGRIYPEGAQVAISPGPGHLTFANLYLVCRAGRLCYQNGSGVCVDPGALGD
jgi:hypothetical protein